LVQANSVGQANGSIELVADRAVDNTGNLVADRGRITVRGRDVTQSGLVQANSIGQANGIVELIASDSLSLQSSSVISAKGDPTSAGASPGGFVTLKGDKTFSDTSSSLIDVSGANNGPGGIVQVLVPGVDSAGIHSTVNNPFALLLNPFDVTISTSPTDLSSQNPNFSKNTLLRYSQIDVQAVDNIELSTTLAPVDRSDNWGTISLGAGNNLILDNGASIKAGLNWEVDLVSGTKLASAAARQAGSDGIYLNGNSFIQTQNGDIHLWAGNEVIVNPGYGDLASGDVGNNGIRTLAGGNIQVTAKFGDVNTGGNAQGFSSFRSLQPYYRVSKNLGGISTAAGGNVQIDAGGDVTSYLPLGQSGASDAGSGAFGPGNVTINAGGSVFGHFIVAAGHGSVTANNGNAGGPDASQNIALSLIQGSWSVNAPNGNIYLQEVRNPNGVYNAAGGPTAASYHLFDYDPQASVSLNAGGSVYLTGLSLPRPNDAVPMLYPPTLSIKAGADVVLQDTVILFPSASGNLNLTAGGNFETMPNNLQQNGIPELIMSDSGQKQWLAAGDFGEQDHGSSPIEVNNPNPVQIKVGGDMKDVILETTKRTEITVGGDMIDSSFAGQNLHSGDITSITVAGDIKNRSPYNFVILSAGLQNLPAQDIAPNSHSSWASVFSAAMDPTILATLQVPANLDPSQWAAYASRLASLFPAGNPGFVYNADTRRLGFSGQMSDHVRAALEQPLTVLRYGPDGLPVLDSSRHFVTDKVTFSTALATDCPVPNTPAIECLYSMSQGAPSVSDPAGLGYRVGGPGQFNVSARSISLGNSYGILSCGVGDPTGNRYANLASLTAKGADLNITVQDDLNMITSTIAALGGGDVNVNSVSGSMNLGSQELFNIQRGLALGIYTSGHGNVNVTALGEIDISGSRIAAYNGGNINVESVTRDVNCGDGGTAYVTVPSYYVDPNTGLAAYNGEQVFGSGILATTLIDPSKVPGSPTVPGNITVIADHGSILASRGGILQDALNGNLAPGPTIKLRASGYDPNTDEGKTRGNIDLGDSGVIGGTIDLNADGKVIGLIISRQNTVVNAGQSFSGTILSGGTANLSAGGTISGTVIGIGGVNATGGQGVTATLLGQSVSANGSQAQSTLGTSAAATSTSQGAAQAATTDAKQQVGSDGTKEDDDKKKKTDRPVLARRVGRVTVILPKKG
jgi:hypothetical protein